MKKMMKKVIIVALIVAGAIVGLMFVKNRFGGMQFLSSGRMSSGADVTILNDSSEKISVEYKDGDKKVDVTVAPGEKVSGGQGVIRVFTPKKDGIYEITYQYPLSMGATRDITLSQIVDAGKKDTVENEIYIKKGMIGDIKVAYEEAQADAN
jgi:hypothetical protein